MDDLRLLVAAIAFFMVLLAGCTQPGSNIPVEKRCVQDSDCACGKNAAGECFYGNRNYVNVEEQCPDFCTGIAAMFEIKCVENECRQVRISGS
ncbi:hypothetical protein H0O01_04900 [Candidatus Micrarchaeota archaeon]|nr:hypothetical protein [Candidatus Micrarchaeota archaeon]